MASITSSTIATRSIRPITASMSSLRGARRRCRHAGHGRVEVHARHDRVDVDARHGRVEVDPLHDRVHVDAVDDRLDVHRAYDVVEVDVAEDQPGQVQVGDHPLHDHGRPVVDQRLRRSQHLVAASRAVPGRIVEQRRRLPALGHEAGTPEHPLVQEGHPHDGAAQRHAGADDRTGHSEGDVEAARWLLQDSTLDRHSGRLRQTCHPPSLLPRRPRRFPRSG